VHITLAVAGTNADSISISFDQTKLASSTLHIALQAWHSVKPTLYVLLSRLAYKQCTIRMRRYNTVQRTEFMGAAVLQLDSCVQRVFIVAVSRRFKLWTVLLLALLLLLLQSS
jgi:hypothetical protein